MTRLLVIDWDFFFPTPQPGSSEGLRLWDWGHSERGPEAMFLLSQAWYFRAYGFRHEGLPLPGTSGDEAGFWRRFNIDPKCTLFVAESNALAASERVLRGVTDVTLFDAHHDSGYDRARGERQEDALHRYATSEERFDCENWMAAYYLRNAEVRMRYPRWKAWGPKVEPPPVVPVQRGIDSGTGPVDGTFNRVFICRSGVWTPPWIEDAFWRLVAQCPVGRTVKLGEDVMKLEPREWEAETLDGLVADIDHARGCTGACEHAGMEVQA